MADFDLIITVDYELPAGGTGDPLRDMVHPTDRLLNACYAYGARLTVMIEMGELWAFEDPANASYAAALGYDPAVAIRGQLRAAVARGHDVQLHLHPQWIGARWQGGAWTLDYAHYCLTDFEPEAAAGLLRRAKRDLEELFRPCCPGYACTGFRAGHWNTSPSAPFLEALRAAGLRSDTSVFKGGHAGSRAVRFDYRTAFSNVRPWITHPEDINRPAANGAGILELPIATRMCRSYAMLTPRRLMQAPRMLREHRRIAAASRSAGRLVTGAENNSFGQRLTSLLSPRPMKLDFCKLSAGQMLSMVGQLIQENEHSADDLCPMPLVMIGHSKQAGGARELDRFLAAVTRRHGDRIGFSTYRDYVARWFAAAAAREQSTSGATNNACTHPH